MLPWAWDRSCPAASCTHFSLCRPRRCNGIDTARQHADTLHRGECDCACRVFFTHSFSFPGRRSQTCNQIISQEWLSVQKNHLISYNILHYSVTPLSRNALQNYSSLILSPASHSEPKGLSITISAIPGFLISFTDIHFHFLLLIL